MEGTHDMIESRSEASTAISYKQMVFLLTVFWCDSLPKLTQGQLERLSQCSVNRYLKKMQNLSSQDRRKSTCQPCEWHFQSFWVRKVALEVFKEILGATIAILSQQNSVFFSFSFFSCYKCNTFERSYFGKRKRWKFLINHRVHLYCNLWIK